jgi:signal transduction histidine kinase
MDRNDQLVQAQASLTSLNASLELRVEERTAELAQANEQLKDQQQKAIETAKMASLGRMVAGFAHEVNTPVGIAVGAVSQLSEEVRKLENLLQREEVSELEVQEVLSLMTESSHLAQSNLERAGKLVHSFKRTAVDQTSEAVRDFSLAELIDDVLHTLRPVFKRTSIAFAVDCPADLELHGVPGVLTQVLTNLCTNAYSHAYAEGTRGGTVRIGVRRVVDKVELRFADDGAGVQSDHVGKVFEPFFTTNRQRGGSGLGLYIVYSQVTQSLGGTVECLSGEGAGTTFVLRFPFVAPLGREWAA